MAKPWFVNYVVESGNVGGMECNGGSVNSNLRDERGDTSTNQHNNNNDLSGRNMR